MCSKTCSGSQRVAKEYRLQPPDRIPLKRSFNYLHNGFKYQRYHGRDHRHGSDGEDVCKTDQCCRLEVILPLHGIAIPSMYSVSLPSHLDLYSLYMMT